jgi:DNA topoisomerase-1
MARYLVVVESPTKARTIGGFLGQEYQVASSMGHVRDLPRKASEIPAAYAKEEWRHLGVNVHDGFKPIYIVPPEKRQVIKDLQRKLQEADELLLATDEDREGEAIAWHLVEELKPKVAYKRLVFHEITRAAIEEALRSPRDIDMNLVEAQEARRILDRIVGYEISPVLWRKVARGLSAGRVQSVALRMLVDREEERREFRSATWWDLSVQLEKGGQAFAATLVAVDGRRVATGRDYGAQGALTTPDVVELSQTQAEKMQAALGSGARFVVSGIERRPYRRSPPPPFITSTLQQEAIRKLNISAARVMRIAQDLYESGWITYMRTDSTSLSEEAARAAREAIVARFGREAWYGRQRVYKSKVRNAQEAHEAIRPAGTSWRTPEQASEELPREHARLYDLIWRRTLASQMKDAVGESLSVNILATPAVDREAAGFASALFRATGRFLTDSGFLRLYQETREEDKAEDRDEEGEGSLPELREGDLLELVEVQARSHATQPPPRYTEASLVKALEEYGIGRPSTYAAIMETIVRRGYVVRHRSALVPTITAVVVIRLLKKYFERLVDYNFTAEMEEQLDKIAKGRMDRVEWLRRFYFGGRGSPGIKKEVEEKLAEIKAAEVNAIPLGTTEDGTEVVVKAGRFGAFVQVGDRRATLPKDVTYEELDVAKAIEIVTRGGERKEVGRDAATGLPIFLRHGQYGPYLQVGEGPGARNASIPKFLDPGLLTSELAGFLVALPIELGPHPATGEPVVVEYGRYGLLIRSGEKMARVSDPEVLKQLAGPSGLKEAVQALDLSQERVIRAPGGREIHLRKGRFGFYLAEGRKTRRLPRDLRPEELGAEEAVQLLDGGHAAPATRRVRRGAARREG